MSSLDEPFDAFGDHAMEEHDRVELIEEDVATEHSEACAPDKVEHEDKEACAPCSVDDGPALAANAQRTNVHYTHVRTKDASHQQPDSMTREEFYAHLEECYREAYPVVGEESGSILSYGMVVKEKHKDSAVEANRSEHHHAACACTQRHYWNKVATISRKKGVYINAVEHSFYVTMYEYLRVPTKKKPVFELDPTPYFSVNHPQGDALRDVLTKGQRAKGLQGRRKMETDSSSCSEKPKVARKTLFANAFNWVVDHGLKGKKGAKQFQADAVATEMAGNGKLLEFVQRHPRDLEDLIKLFLVVRNDCLMVF